MQVEGGRGETNRIGENSTVQLFCESLSKLLELTKIACVRKRGQRSVGKGAEGGNSLSVHA